MGHRRLHLGFDYRLREGSSFAAAPGAPVSQAFGCLLVLLDQDYPSQPPFPRNYIIRELSGNELIVVFD